MPLLTLNWVDGRPQVRLDGKVVEGVKFVNIELEAGSTPVVQIELGPQRYTNLEEGAITWIVTCPVCYKDSAHHCDLATGEEIETTASGEVPPILTCNDSYQAHLIMTDADMSDTRAAFCIKPPHGNDVKHEDRTGFSW